MQFYYELMIKLRPQTMLIRKDPRTCRVFSGESFNKEYRLARFIKVLNKSMYHYNFEYKEGLNSDSKNFSTIPRFCNNGLYFFRIPDHKDDIPYNLYKYMQVYGSLIADVKIPDYAVVLVESGIEFKTNHLILSNVQSLSNLSIICK